MRLVLTALAVLFIAAPSASAETGIEFYYDGEGHPLLHAAAGSAAADARIVEWRACPSGGATCEPLPDAAYRHRRCSSPAIHCEAVARPGATSAGTTFEAVFETGGVETIRRTAAWNGQAAPTSAVRVAAAAVGQAVRLAPGGWSGGWAAAPGTPDDAIGRAIYACREPSGTDCFALAPDSAVLDQRWAGWHIFASESRSRTWPASRLFPKPVPAVLPAPFPFPYAVPALPAPNRFMTVSAPLPACCVLPAPAPSAELPKRLVSPSAAIRQRAQRRKGRLHVASVRCAVRCAVRLTVRGAGGTIVRSLAVEGARSLTIPPRRGRLRVTVVVDGKRLASGRSRAR